MSRIRKNVQIRRDEILDAAIRLIGERGYHGFTIPELAQRCQLTNGGLLYHFGSKEQLFLEVLEERERRETETVRAALGPGPRQASAPGMPLDAVLVVLRLLMSRSVSEPALTLFDSILLAESLNPDHPAHDYFLVREERIRQWLTTIIDPHATDPPSTALRIYALMDGLERQWLRMGRRFDLLGEWDRAIALILPERNSEGDA